MDENDHLSQLSREHWVSIGFRSTTHLKSQDFDGIVYGSYSSRTVLTNIAEQE
jgi:hypothetical protein